MPKRTPVAEGFVARRTARGTSPNAVLLRAFENEQGRVFLVAPGVRERHSPFIRLNETQATALRAWISKEAAPPRGRRTRRARRSNLGFGYMVDRGEASFETAAAVVRDLPALCAVGDQLIRLGMLYDVEQAVAEGEAFRERIRDNAVSWDSLTLSGPPRVDQLGYISSGPSSGLLPAYVAGSQRTRCSCTPGTSQGSVAARSSPVTSAVTRSTRTTSGSGSRGLTWNSSYHRHEISAFHRTPDTARPGSVERCFPSAARRAVSF